MPTGAHWNADSLLGGDFEGWGVTDAGEEPIMLPGSLPSAADDLASSAHASALAAAAASAANIPGGDAEPSTSATLIQAAIRSHQSRADIEMRDQWLDQISRRGKLTPRDLGELPHNKQQVPEALLGAKNRAAAIAAAKQKAEDERKKAAKLAGKSGAKAKVPRQGLLGGRSKGGGSGAAAAKAAIKDPEWRRANKEFVRQLILEPCIDKACKIGEAMLAARARQAAFETRELPKAVCVGSLFGTAGVSGDAHSTLAVIEQDGLAVVCSRNEFLQLSMHTAPLPQLGLTPLIRQTAQQAADLPSTAKLHSTTVSHDGRSKQQAASSGAQAAGSRRRQQAAGGWRRQQAQAAGTGSRRRQQAQAAGAGGSHERAHHAILCHPLCRAPRVRARPLRHPPTVSF